MIVSRKNFSQSIIYLSTSILLLVSACSPEKPDSDKRREFAISELNDTDYPDNPDISFRHPEYDFNAFDKGILKENGDKLSFIFYLQGGDSISVNKLDIIQFIPETPNHLKKDAYLDNIALINQEWNRNQVKMVQGEFSSTNNDFTRVDVARNCLNSYLWEVIIYKNSDGKELPFAHGWFDFPKNKYRELFEQRNPGKFEKLKGHLVNWKDPESRFINKTLLRKYVAELDIEFADKSDSLYPIAGARLKKRKEIMYPEKFNSMRDLQSDSTIFATFTPPGFYNKKDPRSTELGRFNKLSGLHAFETKSVNGEHNFLELEFVFDHSVTGETTRLVFGGLRKSDFPSLSVEDANKGWKNSMGFGNHSFYESLEEFNAYNTSESHYYGYLSNLDGNWLDSHKIGIDGPVIHWDAKDKNVLHVWLLSFERHALVGHYAIKFKD